jgi:hypothetical protein
MTRRKPVSDRPVKQQFAVIARLDRAIQYAAAYQLKH